MGYQGSQLVDWSLEVIPNFTLEEVNCNCGCGLVILNVPLLEGLFYMRNYFNVPITVNSWTRCLKHNRAVGSKDNSYHRFGKAVDIKLLSGELTDQFIAVAEETFPFVLAYQTFCHCDTRGPRRLS